MSSLVSLSISLISSLFNLTSTGNIILSLYFDNISLQKGILSLSTIDIPTFITKEARNVKHIPPPRRI